MNLLGGLYDLSGGDHTRFYCISGSLHGRPGRLRNFGYTVRDLFGFIGGLCVSLPELDCISNGFRGDLANLLEFSASCLSSVTSVVTSVVTAPNLVVFSKSAVSSVVSVTILRGFRGGLRSLGCIFRGRRSLIGHSGDFSGDLSSDRPQPAWIFRELHEPHDLLSVVCVVTSPNLFEFPVASVTPPQPW